MKAIKLASIAAIALAASFASSAAPSILNNNVTSAGYVTSDVDGFEIDGFTAELGRQWSNDVYASLQYSKASGDVMGWDVDTYILNGVVGKQFAIDEVSVWEVEAGARFYGAEVSGVSVDDTYFTAAANYRRAFSEQLSVTAGLDYVDGTTTFVAGTEYDFSENFGVSFTYWKSSDEDTMMLQLVYRPSK